MDNVALHSRSYNPPSLTSTAESWSTGSASRRTPQQSSTGSTGYPAYYFPKTRPHHATPQQQHQHPSPQHSFSSSQQQRQHSPSPRYSPATEYTNNSNEYHPEQSTQSEPGVSADHDRFSAYVNRFSGLDRQRVGGSNSNNLAQSEVGAVSERIRRYNQRYPDPDPDPETGLASDEEEEQRQTAASPVLVSSTQAERLMSQTTLATSRQSYPRTSSQRQEQSGGRRQSASSTSVQQRQSRFESPKQQRQPRFESPIQQRQPRFESPAQQRSSSSRSQSSAGRTTTSQGSQIQTLPEPPVDDYIQTHDANESFHSSIASPPSASVRDLKKQLWNAEEVLQVADYDQRRSYQPDPEIMSEGSSRRRQSTGGGSTGGQFKSKFVEAALAARLRGKLPQVDMEVPQEVQTQIPRSSFDESSSRASPYHNMEQLKNASYEARSAAVDQRASAYSDQLRSEKRASDGSRPTTPSESKELSRMSDWLEQPRNVTPNKRRNESYQSKTESYRDRDTSVRRRGRDPRDERLGTEFSQAAPSSSEQRRGREHSVERLSRGSSKERTRREYSQEPLGRAPSPFIERRIRAFSQEPSARPPLPSSDRRARDYSAPRGRRAASIEPRARDRSEEPTGRYSSSPTDQRASDFSAEPRGRHTASIERNSPQVYSELPRGRRTASTERRARGYSQEPRGPSVSMEPKAQEYSEEPRGPREDSASSIERLAREFSGDLHGVEEPAKEKARGRDQSAERRRREASVEANDMSTSVERREREASLERTRLADVAAYWQNKTSQRGPPVPSPSPQPPVASTIGNNDIHRSGSPIGCKDMVQPAPVQQPLRTEEKLASTNGTDRKNVSKLVAKLNAVNRDDPQEALALIDSILRQETSSDERGQQALETAAPALQRESPNPVESLSDEEGESDDETSVSSMTNPTYQSAKPYHDQIQVLSQNPFAPENTPPDPSLPKEASPSPFSPSTSSFRRPRPSALQHYASPMNQEDLTSPKEGTMSKAKLRRQLLKDFPPPTSIKVKDSPTPPRAPSPSPGTVQNVRVSMTENRAVQQERLAAPEKALSKLDKFVSNQDALAAKIRVWDEMSNGLNKSKSGDSGQDEAELAVEVEALPIPEPTMISRLPAPPQVPSRRDHPWDGKVPARVEKVNIKDTSMDEAMGIETEMTKRGPEYKAPGVAQKAQEFLSSAFQFGRSNSTPAFSISNDFLDESFEKEPSKFEESFEAEPSNFFSQAPSSNWEVAPRITPEQHENAQRISDDFDAAWVSVPESSFFPEDRNPAANPAANPVSTTSGWPQPKNRTIQKYGQRRGRGPVDLDMSIDTETTASQRSQTMFPSRKNNDIMDTSGERGAIEVALLDEDAPNVQDPPENSSAAAPGLVNGSARNEPNAADSSSSKRRGFLKAFMRKEKKKATTRPKSVSQTSVGAQSMPALPNRPQPVLPLMPLPPGLNQREMAPPRDRNSARKAPSSARNAPSRAPVRTRSNSLERFRSASMAQKFSRVMRLYDHE